VVENVCRIPVPPKLNPARRWRSLNHDQKLRWSRYFLVLASTNGVIWGSSLLFLLVSKPVYTSTWALILPGVVNAVNVNLPEIGQATASSGSAGVATATFDPRANYEYIFTSEQVLRAAARRAEVPTARFPPPRIRSIDNTTLMEMEVTGPSPEDARKRSHALYEAFLERLNQLRLSEISQRDIPSQKILISTQKKLEEAQKKVSAYKSASGLSSLEQVDALSGNIEQLRRQRAEFASQRSRADASLRKLSAELGLSPAEAAEAFKLQADKIFQQTLRDYSEAVATLEVQSSKFGPNHPRIVKEVKRRDAARQALRLRAGEILGRESGAEVLDRLALTSDRSSGREALFQQLVNAQSDAAGAGAQLARIDAEITALEDRLQRLAQKQSKLESLKRDEQIAEAVFASTLAKLDLGQADIFSAFPLIQMAAEPSLPETPSAPKTKLVLAGAAVGSVLVSVGLGLLWLRKPWMGRLSRWISP
jgi:uncharacterized protein involved in exopolysaccharide biosynthesis